MEVMEQEPWLIWTSDYVIGTILELELKSPIPGHRHGLKRPRPPADTPTHFNAELEKSPVISLYEATENALKVSGMTISKKIEQGPKNN